MQIPDETVEQSERRFRAIVSMAADAIICIDERQRIVTFNDGAEAMFGYARSEIIGEMLDRLIPQRFHGRHRQHVDEFRNSSSAARLMGEREAIFAMRRNGEEFPAEATISRIDIGGGHILTVILRDATERENAERLLEARVMERTRELQAEIVQREQTQARLVRAQRMEAFGQLTGGVAHDFNNLLTVISGNLELLADSDLNARQKQLLGRSLDAAVLGARLTQRLLLFARSSRLEPSNLDVNAEVTSVVELLRRTLGEMIVVSQKLAPDLWTIRADGSEVESAIVNLAINARDAMPEGGHLVIETANVTIDDQVIAAKPYDEILPGQYVRLSVSDTGTGMSKQVLQRAFEPFFTTKEPGRGTGLGLATIYGFVKQSNGHLTIYSEIGTGSTISLYLPKVDAAITPMHLPAVPRTKPQEYASGQTVLVVEDNAAMREMTVERLQRLGYETLASASGPAAIAILEPGTRVDLVFSDVIMPGGMSGYDLAAWVAANRHDLPVLLTSGFAGQIANSSIHPVDSVRILQKPYGEGELGRAIKETLQYHQERTSQAKT